MKFISRMIRSARSTNNSMLDSRGVKYFLCIFGLWFASFFWRASSSSFWSLRCVRSFAAFWLLLSIQISYSLWRSSSSSCSCLRRSLVSMWQIARGTKKSSSDQLQYFRWSNWPHWTPSPPRDVSYSGGKQDLLCRRIHNQPSSLFLSWHAVRFLSDFG